MAYTKIHAIKTTVNKAINYICNPAKTDERIFISSYACAPETAAIDFKYTLDHCREYGPNKAYHLIQAFFPGEVDYEEAHQIGKELAGKILEGKYSYVITTHIDKGHIHNHIIFCAADNINHDKYNDCRETYYRIRKISDDLCREHNLSIITPGAERGKKYNEWLANKNDISWKAQIRKDVNAAIKSSSTYDEFILLMKAKGYVIKGESFGKDSAKYISFLPVNKECFVRGSVKSLGKEYTKERIKERIDQKRSLKARLAKKDYADRRIIDTTNEKFQNSPGLMHWATIENLKIAAQNYKDAGSLATLKQKLSVTLDAGKEARQSVRYLEHQIRELGEIIKYAEQYKLNRSYQINYKKAKDPDAYFRKHESQLILYEGAKSILEQSGLDLKSLNINKLESRYQELTLKKEELTATYKKCDKEIKEMTQILRNLELYLNPESTQSSPSNILQL